jgi:hypothetical protein
MLHFVSRDVLLLTLTEDFLIFRDPKNHGNVVDY